MANKDFHTKDCDLFTHDLYNLPDNQCLLKIYSFTEMLTLYQAAQMWNKPSKSKSEKNRQHNPHYSLATASLPSAFRLLYAMCDKLKTDHMVTDLSEVIVLHDLPMLYILFIYSTLDSITF